MAPSIEICMLLITFLSSAIKAKQDCLQASNGNRPLPNFVRPGSGTRLVDVDPAHPIQVIITSYRFNCCGVVTEWRAFVEGSSGAHFDSQPYTISFQVWRPSSPSPVDNDGCYSMVGMNHFSPIPLADPQSPDRGMVNGTVPESERIEVQPGDVVGYYLESSMGSRDGIQFAGDDDNDPDYTDEAVWYIIGIMASIGPPQCPLPVGPDRTLSSSTNRAPLITVSLFSRDCPSVQPTYTLQSQTESPSPTPSHKSSTPSHQSPAPTSVGTTFPESAPDNIGLYVGITVPVFILMVSVVVIVGGLSCVAAKMKKNYLQSNSELMSYSVSNDEQIQQTKVNNDHPIGPIILSSQNPAYGEVPTRAEDDQDYYINEEMGGATGVITRPNEAYASHNLTGSNPDPSIPTTENQAYTSVSADTERVRGEETYDYVREL